MPVLRVLAIAPEIDTLPRLAQASEMTRLGDASTVDVDPLIGPLVTQERIQSRLRNNSYEVVLWSGHGHNGRLLLPGGKEVEPRWLASEVNRSGARLVVLAVCDSAQRKGFEGFADVLPASGISVVAMISDVGDTAAIDYDVALLHALANEENLREAHRIGLEAIKNVSDRIQPQLFMADSRLPIKSAARKFTLEELQVSYDALTGRIVALDVDIAREVDSERRRVLLDRRTELSIERERTAADIAILHPGYPLAVVANASIIEHRLTKLEDTVKHLWEKLNPGPRKIVAMATFYALIVVLWSTWLVKEFRDWMLDHPAQAIIISLALVVAALIIRWLPEDDHER